MEVLNVLEKDRFAKEIGIELKEAVDGRAVLELMTTKKHLNGGGMVQGGVLFTLADSAMAAAANSHGKLAISVEGHIQYLRSVEVNELLRAEAIETHRGKRMSFYAVSIFKKSDELVATMTGISYYVEEHLDNDAE